MTIKINIDWLISPQLNVKLIDEKLLKILYNYKFLRVPQIKIYI